MKRKGIIMAGGSGTRLYPLTRAVSKQLLPVYDKPMIYYPLTILMLAGIQDIAIITTAEEKLQFQRLLGDGEDLGLKLTWLVQPRPEGLAQAYILAEEFLDGAPSAMILGDNIYFGEAMQERLERARDRINPTVFAYRVSDPERYGVIEIDDAGRALSITEKPAQPRSNYVMTGLYFFDERASSIARNVKPSTRGELEITDIAEFYLQEGSLVVETLGRGYAWLDTGTHNSLMAAGEFVRTIEQRQGLKIGCPEEVAYRLGFISREQCIRLAASLVKTGYGAYLMDIVG